MQHVSASIYYRSSPREFLNPIFGFYPEPVPVPLVVVAGLDVQRVVEVEQVGEEGVEAPDDVFEAASRRPPHPVDRVLPEDREADVALLVDVGVPELGQAPDLGRPDVVVVADDDVEAEFPPGPESLVGADDQAEIVQLVGVVELDLAARRQGALHLLNFFDQELVSDRDPAAPAAAADAAAAVVVVVAVGFLT